MGVYSIYIPSPLDSFLKERIEGEAKKKSISVSSLVTQVLSSFFSEKSPASEKWASSLSGSWKGGSAKKMIGLIEKNRTRFQPDF